MKFKSRKIALKRKLEIEELLVLVYILVPIGYLISLIAPSLGKIFMIIPVVLLFSAIPMFLHCIIDVCMIIYKYIKAMHLPLNEAELNEQGIQDVETYCDFLNHFYHTSSILKNAYSEIQVETPSLFKHKTITFDEVKKCFIVEEERLSCSKKDDE
ncbi:hypothetical protein MKA27_17420 [[Clostridium] innocuum]|uniref:hypothetical protein n=1 Tax=Clostridium innocuum TaxID=1522 RepID=UPI000D6B481F|nr:hypothetical protein [[Clostridium] innocuum]MCR0315845.1 hypothetical protein [[Clostridium] innocuum]MCR0370954.1 hypothetical protein [[Clostridium] innocuum]MCR0375592.1 hypothetical protein [[Clostridium] innocuum]MCR0560930.1 hypothetical protein [[Clostridium] innocuum]MCR0603704.1 hypothetical protein [[Clostridium] innocuum]